MTKAEKLDKLKKRQAEELAKTRMRADTIRALEMELDAERVKEIRKIYEAHGIPFDAITDYLKTYADKIADYIKRNQQVQAAKDASSAPSQLAQIHSETAPQQSQTPQEYQEEEENPYA